MYLLLAKRQHNANDNKIDCAKWNTEQKREGDPLLKLQCSVVTHLSLILHGTITVIFTVTLSFYVKDVRRQNYSE